MFGPERGTSYHSRFEVEEQFRAEVLRPRDRTFEVRQLCLVQRSGRGDAAIPKTTGATVVRRMAAAPQAGTLSPTIR